MKFLVFLFLLVSTSSIDCLERLVSEMTCYVLSGTLSPTHSLTHTSSQHEPGIPCLLIPGMSLHCLLSAKNSKLNCSGCLILPIDSQILSAHYTAHSKYQMSIVRR